MRHYATLFDSKFLPQGLALYESLKKHSSEEFMLYVLAMDDECASILKSLHPPAITEKNLKGLAVVGLDSIEYCDYRRIDWFRTARAERSHAEFCWTMGSVFTELCMDELRMFQFQTNGPSEVTYLDADCYFFSDPKVIFDEIGDRSIAVIPHRWNEKDRKRLEVNGKFNVSWVTFKNNAIGRECLSMWAALCRGRCSAKVGCGDQKYLDEWVKYGDELCVIENIGAGVAPWNMTNYRISEGPKVDGVPVVFHHYHEFRELPVGIEEFIAGKLSSFRLTNYKLRDEDITYIYEPYVAAYKEAKQRIEAVKVSA